MLEFRWNDANREHIGKHNVTVAEVEYVVRHARRPYPQKRENRKFYVAGQTPGGTYIQVVFVIDPPPMIYVIHARPLEDNEMRVFRRRIR
ncbi:MAG: DUF4258 domain-containing protein [Tepidisphaeraceae bacterium]